MVSLMRALVSIVAGFLVLAALATWGGALHPAGDSLAVARLPLVALAALVVIWTGWARWLRWGLAGVALVVLGQAVVMKLATPSPGVFSVYQKNLLYRNAQIPELAADMLAQAPDVITLQELTSRNGDILDRLAPVYPHRATCPFYSWSRNAVLSRHPVLPGGTLCLPGQGVAGLHLDTPQGPVWGLSVHLRWPWPHPQAFGAAPDTGGGCAARRAAATDLLAGAAWLARRAGVADPAGLGSGLGARRRAGRDPAALGIGSRGRSSKGAPGCGLTGSGVSCRMTRGIGRNGTD